MRTAVLVIALAVTFAPPVRAKKVVCIDGCNTAAVNTMEGYERQTATFGDEFRIGVVGNGPADLTECLALVADGDALVIIAHGNKNKDGTRAGKGFFWDGKLYAGFGTGADLVPVPKDFEKRTKVAVTFRSCWSLRDPDGARTSLVSKLIDAMGGEANEHKGFGFKDFGVGNAQFGRMQRGPNNTKKDADFFVQKAEALNCVRSEAFQGVWMANPPVNRNLPVKRGDPVPAPPNPNQQTAAQALIDDPVRCPKVGGNGQVVAFITGYQTPVSVDRVGPRTTGCDCGDPVSCGYAETTTPPPCEFDTNDDGLADLIVPDVDGDGVCDFPTRKTHLHGTLTFTADTPVQFRGTTILEADRIVIEPDAVLRGDPATLRALTVVATNGDLESDGTLDIGASDDLLVTAVGALRLRGPTGLRAVDRLVLDARAGDLEVAPRDVVAGVNFTVFAANRLEVRAKGARGSIQIAHAVVGAPRVRIDARANVSVNESKEIHVFDDAVLTTDPARTGGVGSPGDIVLMATGRVRVDDDSLVDSGHNVLVSTGADLCVIDASTMEALSPSGAPGRLYFGGVRGAVRTDELSELIGLIVGARDLTFGPCP